MRFTMMVAAAALVCGPAFAGDKDMSCAEIAAEIEELNAIEAAAGDAKMTDDVAKAGTGAAVNAALYSGAGSSIPLFGSLANVATAVTSANAENAKERAEDAEKRTIKLETIADMKGC